MEKTLKRIWFPFAVVCIIALQAIGMGKRPSAGDPGYGFVSAERPQVPDTIKYRNQFLRGTVSHSFDTSAYLSLMDTSEIIEDTIPRLTARDTIFPPDSLKHTNPFRYKYYVALLDSLTHEETRDSLKAAGDSIDWPILDSLYDLDLKARKKAEWEAWYNSMSDSERKKYDRDAKEMQKKRIADSLQVVKDSIKARRDSIREAAPRILSTFALPDSMQYKRIIQWSHEREFHKMNLQEPDTNYNFRFNDYPFLRNDVNATWLGVAGSAVQYYNYFNRESDDGVFFYDPYEPWSYSARTVPMYNTKTPYTELAYFGTIFANSQKESDNLHILTTQNLWPEFNFSLEYNRFGGNGMVQNEKTSNKTFSATTNYLGKRYLMHSGYIRNKVVRNENGGISDNKMVSDTTLDAREFPIHLTNASNTILKKTWFVDQQYRIPFTFIRKMQNNSSDKKFRENVLKSGDSVAISLIDSLVATRRMLREQSDTLGDEDITTAFIGHSTEYTSIGKLYTDQISATDADGRSFYKDYLYHPTNSRDSAGVTKLENRLFIRIQPWSDDAIVSKLNGGVGNRLMTFYSPDPQFLKAAGTTRWNSTFVYAGVEGQLREYIHWDATGDYVFLGEEQNDFSVRANALLTMHPFRKAKSSPVFLNLHFGTSLTEPQFYQQHFFSNHYRWDNDFDKISTTRFNASLDIPRWDVSADFGYALLMNNIYFDTLGVIRQNASPMSVISASLTKNLKFGPLHLDNRVLFQVSSDQDVIPLPALAFNERLYLQFDVQKGIMQMQLGANVWYNTKFYSPSWNPAIGSFQNQKEVAYNNGPFIDAFINVQWKRACIFVKMENAGQGWPMDKADYFSANHYIRTQRSLKIGIYWPFYKQTTANETVNASSGLSSSGSRSGSAGTARRGSR